MTKIKIKPSYPETPGLEAFNWKIKLPCADFDFMDDVNATPMRSLWKVSTPFHAGFNSGDWEDFATIYRGHRDLLFQTYREYFFGPVWYRVPFLTRNSDSDPGNSWYKNIQINPVDGPWTTNENTQRFQFPDPNGMPNFEPVMHMAAAAEPYHNSGFPIKDVLFKAFKSLKLDDIYNTYHFIANEGWDEQSAMLPNDSVFEPGQPADQSYRESLDIILDLYSRKGNALRHVPGYDFTPEDEALLNQRKEHMNSIDVYEGRSSVYHGSGNGNVFRNYFGFNAPSLPNIADDAMPVDVFGPTAPSLNILPGVNFYRELGATKGNPGDIVFVYTLQDSDFTDRPHAWNPYSNYGSQMVAWDPINEEWSNTFYSRFFEYFIFYKHSHIENIFNLFRDSTYSMKPFTWSNHHAPVMNMFDDIRDESAKVVPDYNQYRPGIAARYSN